MGLPTDKGHELERRIAEFFKLHGHATRRNVVLEGRSGGRHELDVLAEKSDGITTYRLVVECKAWETPIEKDVVAKLDYIVHDLGLNKAIVVALARWRTGAEQSAQQLGIELWGPEDLEAKLGQVALARLRAGPAVLSTMGFPLAISRENARPAIAGQSRSRLGLGREEILGTELVWVPFHLLQIACSRMEKQVFRKPSLKTRTIWNAYEAIDGSFFASWDEAPQLAEVSMEIALRPRVKDNSIVSKLRQTVARAAEVVRADAQGRYTARLAALGIPPLTRSISIDSWSEFYIPFFLARLRARGAERLVAADGVAGRPNDALGRMLTQNMTYVLETARQQQQPSGEDQAPRSEPLPPRPDASG